MKLIVAVLLALTTITAAAGPVKAEGDMECLAKNIYFEARNQSLTGKIAVSHVVLNRVFDDRFPNNICDVIYQARLRNGFPIRHQCQFSWYCDGLSDVPKDRVSWEIALNVARDAMLLWENAFDITSGATHYHTTQVNPSWNRDMEMLVRIDDHIFWKN